MTFSPRLSSKFFALLVIVFNSGLASDLVANESAQANPDLPNIEAKSFVLMDFKSGKILADSNADLPLPPASLTKIMTSYIVADELAKGSIAADDKVLISENAWAQNPKLKGSSLMFVEVNKYVDVNALHKGIVIQSGNDASIAMAEFISGTEDAFSDLMNQHASRLGMASSQFKNSTGLPDQGHITTARDLAILSRALISDFPEDYTIYSEKEFTYNKITQHNRNALLNDQGLQVDGLKTGHTEEAGYCLVSSGVNKEMRLIAVVMGTESKSKRASESRKLLNYGFRFFTNVTPFKGGKTLKNARVWKGVEEEFAVGLAQDATLMLLKSEKPLLKANYILNQEIIAPIKKGQKVGEIFFKVNGNEVKRLPMVALESVEEVGFMGRMWDSIKLWF